MSTTYPRTILPEEVSDLWIPAALKDISHAGIAQIRAIGQVGWWWQERYPPLSVRDVNAMVLKTLIDYAHARGEILDITHPLTPGSGISPNGLGTAGVLVNGASQTGNTLAVDGYPVSTSNCIRAGDALKIAGDNGVYICRGDAGSNGLGQVTIPIIPNLRVSPADNAAVTLTGVQFRCVLWTRSQFNRSRSPHYYAGMEITLVEALA